MNAVRAIDPSELFVEAVRKRIPGLDAHVGTADKLPFADDTIDVALAQRVVYFMPGRWRASALTVRVHFSSFEDWWSPFTLGVGPAGAQVALLELEQAEALGEKCESPCPAESFSIDASAWTVVAPSGTGREGFTGHARHPGAYRCDRTPPHPIKRSSLDGVGPGQTGRQRPLVTKDDLPCRSCRAVHQHRSHQVHHG